MINITKRELNLEMEVRERIKTSYFISNDLLKELEEAHKKTGINKEKLAQRCLLKFLRVLDKIWLNKDNVIGYQSRGKCYGRLNFHWTAKEYVFLLQLRYYLRISISCLLSRAIKKYIQQIVRTILRIQNNYDADLNKSLKKSLEKIDSFKIFCANIRKDIPIPKDGSMPLLLYDNIPFFCYSLDFFHY